MNKLFAALFAVFTSAAPAQVDAADPAVRKPGPKGFTTAMQSDFKNAVKESDVAAIQAMLDSGRVALSDELGGGRGLLQFAVMSNAVKPVRALIAAGANPATPDSLGASAMTLARKQNRQGMVRVLEGGDAAAPVAASA
jgi:hypothetical protein